MVVKNIEILQHWGLLIDSLHISLQMDIKYDTLNEANEMLKKFVKDAEKLYSLKSMTFNVHISYSM